MNLIQFLAMNLHQGPVFKEFNQCRSSFQDGFREVRPKSVVYPETIDAVCQLVLQDLHVTYREIETTLGISETSIHSIFHEHLLDCQKKLLALDPTQFVIRFKKKARIDWSKEMLQKYDRDARL